MKATVLAAAVALSAGAEAASVDSVESKLFTARDFRLESGTVLPELAIARRSPARPTRASAHRGGQRAGAVHQRVVQTRRLGIVMNGVTGRMGKNQHLLRSMVAIARQGGVRCGDVQVLPDPVLVGRDAGKLREVAAQAAQAGLDVPPRWTTDLAAAVRDERCDVVFDASTTHTSR